ncbi:MAG: hypothetical protein ACU843_03860 [Gammaproteobacteria bacterium]
MAFVLASLLSACAMDQKHREMAENQVATATTKSDHEAIADHYEQQAEAALNQAEQMRKHLRDYESSTTKVIPRQKEIFIRHCKSLIYKYDEIAEDNKALARLHREMAEGM